MGAQGGSQGQPTLSSPPPPSLPGAFPAHEFSFAQAVEPEQGGADAAVHVQSEAHTHSDFINCRIIVLILRFLSPTFIFSFV